MFFNIDFVWDTKQYNASVKYYPGTPQTRECPGEPDEFEIVELSHDGNFINMDVVNFMMENETFYAVVADVLAEEYSEYITQLYEASSRVEN